MPVIFNDTFTDTNGTALTAHTPDTGTGWTEEQKTGTAIQEIQSNHAQASASETNRAHIYSAQPNPSDTDYDVEFTLTAVASTSSDTVGLIARFVDTSNYYVAIVRGDGLLRIDKLVSGSLTNLDNLSGSISNGDTFKFELRGTTLKLYQNGTERLSATDSEFSSAGKAGYGLGTINVFTRDISSDWHIDDFSVTESAIDETGKTVTITGSVSETNVQSMIETAKTLTIVGALSVTDFKVLFETGLSFTAVVALDETDTYVHVETGRTITAVGVISETNNAVYSETGRDFSIVGVLDETDIYVFVETGRSFTITSDISAESFFFVPLEKINHIKSWILIRFFNDE